MAHMRDHLEAMVVRTQELFMELHLFCRFTRAALTDEVQWTLPNATSVGESPVDKTAGCLDMGELEELAGNTGGGNPQKQASGLKW